ncbi:extracellular solute-binding protein [Streptomyces sp. 1331.2]|uniref:extracellular solute-binding protein n=1 Tax=Streptomyces sp. 1331.2 TaxID=1938835 RepID=UPI000BD14D5B|nr:extracellular solute-binding protein [Streptomyces sp. 1331.2]SOB85625.1 carbohydrate ABC transporter substrate-binding protein, CUT1 family [Streptomyces sp. 1331.2]
MSKRIDIDIVVPLYPFMPYFLDRTRELAETFTAAHPEYRIHVTGADWLSVPQAVADAALKDGAPTIAQYFYTSTQDALDARRPDGSPLFTSVERAIAGRTEILGEPVVLGDVTATARQYYRHDGAVAAMPPLTSTTLLYANTTLLERAGITEVPQTWAGIEAACRAVAALPDGPAHAITWPNHGWWFQQSVAQQGALLADHDNGRSGRAERVYLDSDAMLAYVEWWRGLHRAGLYRYHPSRVNSEVDWDGNFRAFADQQVAFTLTTSVEAARMAQAGRDGGFTVQTCRMPYNDRVPYAGNVIGGDALWLAAGLDEATQDGALAFMQYLNSPRIAADRHRETGFIPVTGGAIDLLEQEGWFRDKPHFRTALDQLGANAGTPAAQGALLGEFAAIQDVLTTAMHDVLVTEVDPRVRFAEANAQAQQLLDHYNEACRGLRPRGPVRVG